MALAFLGAGFAKATSQEAMVQAFSAFGLPVWFCITIGILEVLGGIFLLIPAFSGMSSFGLSIIMIGAVMLHATHDPILAALPAFVFLILLTVIYMTRKNVVPKVVQKYLVG